MDEYYAKGGDAQFQTRLNDLVRGSTIWDVGGNKGGFAEAALAQGMRVIAFEPMPDLVEHLQQRFKGNSRFEVRPYALTATGGALSLARSGAHDSATSAFSGKDGLQVPARTLDAALQGSPPVVDMITINCEGCEFEVMESMVDQHLTSRFRIIQIQFHPGLVQDDLQRRCAIQERLHETHELGWSIPWIWERWVLRA